MPALEGDPGTGETDERPDCGEENPVAPAGSLGGGGTGLRLLPALSPGSRALLGRRGKVIDYCLRDVHLTKLLFAKAVREGQLVDPRDNEKMIPVRKAFGVAV